MKLESETFGKILCPFASEGDRSDIPESYNPYKANFAKGFPSGFSVPVATGGVPFTRKLVNELAYRSTLGGFLAQIGYEPTFNQNVCDAMGGYPKGTVLRYFEETYDSTDANPIRLVRDVVSLQDDNTKNFVYDETDNPDPYEIGSEDEDGVVWWQFTEEDADVTRSRLPDLFSMTLVDSATFTSAGATTWDWRSQYDGWLQLQFSSVNHDAMVTLLEAGDTDPNMLQNTIYYAWGLPSDTAILNAPGYVYDNLRFAGKGIIVPSNAGSTHRFFSVMANVDYPIEVKIYYLGEDEWSAS